MPKKVSKTLTVSKPAPAPLSLRRGKARFRFDDRPITGESVWVFAPVTGNIEDDIGLYGAPVAVLDGYKFVPPADREKTNSVTAAPGEKTMGRLLELTVAELHRLDAVAEHSGLPLHRFVVSVRTAHLGHRFEAWVFQQTAHATTREEMLSATNQTKTASVPALSV